MLNMTFYEIKAKYGPTNRWRTITMYAHSENEVLALLKGPEYVDYTEIKSITPLPEEAPSQRQIDFAISLGIHIEKDFCRKDLSALIDRKLGDRSAPNPGLVDFADEHNILFSEFIGKKGLYDTVFSQLDTVDRIAFFIFSVYRFLSNNREANLNKSEYRELIYQKANEWRKESNIINSMDSNYAGADLRFFGTLILPDGNQTYGGKRSTLVFRKTVDFLMSKGLITDDKKGPLSLSQLKGIEDVSVPYDNHDSQAAPSWHDKELSSSKKETISPQSNKFKDYLGTAVILVVIIYAS